MIPLRLTPPSGTNSAEPNSSDRTTEKLFTADMSPDANTSLADSVWLPFMTFSGTVICQLAQLLCVETSAASYHSLAPNLTWTPTAGLLAVCAVPFKTEPL